MTDQSWTGFKEGVRRWWPILIGIVSLGIMGAAHSAVMLTKIEDHETRLNHVETIQRGNAERLKGIEVTTANTERTVSRMEDKMDRLVERAR